MSSISFLIEANRQNLGKLQKKKFSEIYRRLLQNFQIESKDIELLLTDSPKMKELNFQFRRKNRPTDVLSFPSNARSQLGSVVIDLQTARIQAPEYQNSFEVECYQLFIHGCLHLLGFNHESEPEAALMGHYEDFFNFLLK